MRNLKKVLCLALVLSMVLAVVAGALGSVREYADYASMTIVNEEYTLAAQLLNDLGIVVGVTNDAKQLEYQPNAELNRAEMARVLYVLHTGIEEGSQFNTGAAYKDIVCSFTDIDDCWAKGEIKYGWNEGYLSGRNATTYDPDAKVSVREMATALLAVIGYEKADLAKNWPNNVIKYGYNKNANLFTTGLSTNPSDINISGWHIAGYKTGIETEDEGELTLSANITREQAFYMLYKAIAKAPMVWYNKKVEDYYWDSECTFLNAVWNVEIEKDNFDGMVVAGPTKSLGVPPSGEANAVGIYNPWQNQLRYYKDLGTSYTVLNPNGNAAKTIGTGFSLVAEDWDADLGKFFYGDVITIWKDGEVIDKFIQGYDFDKYENAPSGNYGKSYEIPSGTKVSYDSSEDELTVGDMTLIIDDDVLANTGDGKKWFDDADDAAAAMFSGESEKVLGNLTLYTDGNGTVYGFENYQYTYAKVSLVESDKITLEDVYGGETLRFKVGEYLGADGKAATPAVGDRVYGYWKYDDKADAYVFYGKLATKVQKAVVTIDNTGKMTADGNEIKAGIYKNVKYYVNTPLTAVNAIEDATGKYYDLYMSGNEYFEFAEVAQVQEVTAGVLKAKTRVVNTADSTASYTFVVAESSASGAKEFTFNYTWEVNDGDDTSWKDYAVGNTVKFSYDVKTLATVGELEQNLPD